MIACQASGNWAGASMTGASSTCTDPNCKCYGVSTHVTIAAGHVRRTLQTTIGAVMHMETLNEAGAACSALACVVGSITVGLTEVRPHPGAHVGPRGMRVCIAQCMHVWLRVSAREPEIVLLLTRVRTFVLAAEE